MAIPLFKVIDKEQITHIRQMTDIIYYSIPLYSLLVDE